MFQHPATSNEGQPRSRLGDRDQPAAHTAERNSRACDWRSVGLCLPARRDMPAGIVAIRAEQILDALAKRSRQIQCDRHARLICAGLNRTQRLTRNACARSEVYLGKASRTTRAPYGFSDAHRCQARRSYAIIRAN